MTTLTNHLNETTEFLKEKGVQQADFGLILGSGLGELANEITDAIAIPFSEIPHFSVSTVVGHAGQLVYGTLSGKKVLAMQGRFHYYEGHSMQTVTYPVRVMAALGIHSMIVTNAAGGVNETYTPGNLMLINDHINFTGDNPLIGENDEEIGPRFPDMSHAYTQEYREVAKKVAAEQNIDAVLVAIGRVPNGKNLDAGKAGVEVDDRGFIRVDKQLRTNVPHIFAIGDIVGQPMLAHKGVHEGHVAAEVIAGKKHYFDPKVIPSIAYTEPEVAWVGLTEKEAKEKGISYETATFPWAASGRAIASDCADGMTKLIFDKESHRVIGGAIVGTNGGELLGEIGLAIEMGCDAEDIALTIHAHPTLHESVGLAAEVFEGSITDLPNPKAKKK